MGKVSNITVNADKSTRRYGGKRKPNVKGQELLPNELLFLFKHNRTRMAAVK